MLTSAEGNGWFRNLLVSFALIAVFCSCTSVAEGGGSGLKTSHDLEIRGKTRSYELYRPALPDGDRVPLMIVLHGGLGDAHHAEATTGMNAVADRGKFIVAYPEGTGGRLRIMRNRRTWNAGRCCGRAVEEKADDVGFIAAMIDDIVASQPVDAKRVYVTGMSNGAMMAYRLACEIPEKLAAIIPVAGTLAVDDCGAAKDVPVMHIHGDRDPNVPLEGGHGDRDPSGVAHRSIPETMRMVTAPRGCSGSKTTALNDSVDRTSYTCKGGAPVELVVVKGGGHSWPGGRYRQGKKGVSKAISASQMAWDFARQFTKK